MKEARMDMISIALYLFVDLLFAAVILSGNCLNQSDDKDLIDYLSDNIRPTFQ